MPEAWTPGGDFGSPTYSLPIRVVDSAKSTLIGERRERWRDAVKLSLSRWGLPFDLDHRPESTQAYVVTAETLSNLGVNPLIIPDAIALVRLHSAVGESNQNSGGWIQEMGGGICIFAPWRGWWAPFPPSQITQIITHEIGHALGFGHGGNGVMSGAFRPNAQEVALAAAYYLA